MSVADFVQGVRDWAPVAGWVAVASLVSFTQFYRDKAAARDGRWRLSEASLLATAFLGGALGAKAGQRAFRHKTRKEPFRSVLNLALVANLGVIAALAWPPARTFATEAIAAMIAGLADA